MFLYLYYFLYYFQPNERLYSELTLVPNGGGGGGGGVPNGHSQLL